MGWFGLVYLILYTLPTLGPRWLFFFFCVTAIAGPVLPLVAFLNRRFPTDPPADRRIIVRESALIGFFVAMLAWLQLGRVLSLGVGLGLAAGILLIEVFLRLRDKSRWEP